MFLTGRLNPTIQPLYKKNGVSVDVLRLDLLDEISGGNKVYKLKYNIAAALAAEHKTILTFGGASSNHIAATALVCRQTGLRSIGIIRGSEPPDTATLRFARSQQMKLVFEDKTSYRKQKEHKYLSELRERFGAFHLVPEGGNNLEGYQGCREIIPEKATHNFVAVACGTGTTFGGMLEAGAEKHRFVGISVLKGPNFLPAEVSNFLQKNGRNYSVAGDECLSGELIDRHCILSIYASPGYARFNRQIADYKKSFELRHAIPLDHIYTARLFFGVEDLCASGRFPEGSSVLVIHSGGLQGNAAFEQRYQRKLSR